MKSLTEHAAQELAKCSLAVCCKLCDGEAPVFDVVDLNKTCNGNTYPRGLSGIPVLYRRCLACGFIFTAFFDCFTAEDWRSIIYNDEYASVDPDYLDRRPRENARHVQCLLFGARSRTVGLDYGGGNGMTAQLLRGRGWQFDCIDPHGENQVTSDRIGRYGFCCAWEVFEHLTDPVSAMSTITATCAQMPFLLVIGTSVHDGIVTNGSRLAWQYAAPRNGHVSLYSRASLRLLAARNRLEYVSISRGTHVLTRGISSFAARTLLIRGKALMKMWMALRPL